MKLERASFTFWHLLHVSQITFLTTKHHCLAEICSHFHTLPKERKEKCNDCSWKQGARVSPSFVDFLPSFPDLENRNSNCTMNVTSVQTLIRFFFCRHCCAALSTQNTDFNTAWAKDAFSVYAFAFPDTFHNFHSIYFWATKEGEKNTKNSGGIHSIIR